MSLYLTSSTLIDDIRRRAMLPQNQKTFQTADFLSLANTELQIGLVPSILTVHEEYFVDSKATALIANQSSYPLPERAIGNRLRDLFYRDTQGTLHEMTRVSPDDKAYFQSSHLQNRFIAFYMQGDQIVLSPPVGPNPTGSLIFTYFRRPSELVEANRVATILSTAVGATTTTLTFASIPSIILTTFSSYPNTKFDINQVSNVHKTKAEDIVPVSMTATTITFNNSDLPPTALDPLNIQPDYRYDDIIEAGDYIAFASESIIPQIPNELHSVLSQRVAMRCLESLGDQQGLAAAGQKLAEMEVKTGTLIDNRVEGSPQKITNYGSLLRTSRVRRRGWF